MIRYIYTFFVGLFLAIFIGMGIAVFYPEPTPPQEPAVLQSIGKNGPTEAQQHEIDAYNTQQKEFQHQQWHHNKYVSVIVLVCAVIILAIALSLSDKLGIIADGILLGGIFTLLYGIGRGMATDSNKYRFLVATIGLATTLILGYLKFTRAQIKKSKKTAGNVLLKVVLWIVTLSVAGGAVYSTYLWQHSKVDNLNQQVAQLNTELATARKSQLPKVTYSYTSKKGVSVKVYTPISESQLNSPAVIMGEVPGNWSFEASFPVKLLDAKGNVIAQTPAQLLGDWMTDKPVPFTAKLTFASAPSGEGKLLLQKDNPSGLEANDDSVSVPVKL